MAGTGGTKDFSLERQIALESENYTLKKNLTKICQERDDLTEKYHLLAQEYARTVAYIHRLGHKMTKFVGRKGISGSTLSGISLSKADTPDSLDRIDSSVEDINLELKLLPDDEAISPTESSSTCGQLTTIGEQLDENSNPSEGKTVDDIEKGSLEQIPVPGYTSFDEMDLKDELLRGIHEYGWEKLFNTDESSVIPILIHCQDDVIVEDGCRSGLAAITAFSAFILQKIDTTKCHCQALILVPYRELALKIQNVMKDIGKFLNVKPHACIGRGIKVKEEKRILANGVQIVIGTPGRVYDMIVRKCFNTENISYFVMDEADILLSDIFMGQTHKVLNELPKLKRMVLFATKMSPEVSKFCDDFMEDQTIIRIKEKTPSLDNINQFYVLVDSYDEAKEKALLDIRERFPYLRMVVYCNGLKQVRFLKQYFDYMKEPLLTVHADMKLDIRKSIMRQFCTGSIATLVTTEMPNNLSYDDAEGLHLENVSLLVNYELPETTESYFSRVLHCGSHFSENGIIVNVITVGSSAQILLLEEIESIYGTQIIELAGRSFPLTDM